MVSILWGWILSINLEAQTVFNRYTWRHWDSRKGLPIDLVSYITQTRDGFIWMTSFQGLTRFDGVEFTTFNTSNEPLIKTNNFDRPFEDPHGVLWIPTSNSGLLAYEQGEFTAYNLPERPREVVGITKGGTLLMESAADTMMVAFHCVTHSHYLLSKSTFFQWVLADSLVNKVIRVTDGTSYFHYQNTVYQIVGKTYKPITFDSTTVSQFVPEIHLDQQKRLWLMAISGLYYWNGQKFVSFAPEQRINFAHLGGTRKPLLVEDKTGQIWLGTTQGLGLIRAGKQEVEFLPEDHPLRRENITSMMTDHSGQLWVGTEGGLYYINPSHVKIYSLSSAFGEKRISAVAVGDDNSYFIGGNSGEIFTIKNDQIVKQKSEGFEPFQLFVDRKGSLWKLSVSGRFVITK